MSSYILLFEIDSMEFYKEKFWVLENDINKQILLIIILNLKIIFFIICFILNVIFFASNICDKKFKIKNIDEIEPILVFNSKSPIYLITIVVNASYIIYTYITNILKRIINFINHNENSNKINSIIIKSSLIISALIVDIIVNRNEKFKYTNIKNTYGKIVTSLLIPIVYDSIKKFKEPKKNQKKQ